jgi:inosine-uridine nucleoside N-ribohydrolase
MLRQISLMAMATFWATLGLNALTNASDDEKSNGGKTLFVDTDIGIDDALAIAWLLLQPQANVVGFSTVFGNTAVEHATRNMLTLLQLVGKSHIPISIGASQPLVLPRTRTGALVHGPDGLWFGQQQADISALPNNAAAALVAAAQAHPGLVVIALGPVTNIANAIQLDREAMASSKIIVLGGGTRGNRTPAAEFNIYADPHALEIVLNSGIKIDMVTLDAFEQVRIDIATFPQKLAASGPLGQFLAGILGPYLQIQMNYGQSTATIPDAAAVIYALQPALATSESALVRVVVDGLARGQTLIASSFRERMPLIATEEELSSLADEAFTPGFDLNARLGAMLQRVPDNVQVVLKLDGEAMAHLLEQGLTNSR